jgi:hypothetical protein
MEAEARYAHLKELAATVPDFGAGGAPNNDPQVFEWLGRLHALLQDPMFGSDGIQVNVSSNHLGDSLHNHNVRTIMASLYRAISTIEMKLPASSRGAFIPAGNAFDAITATARILSEAKSTVLIVDPYLGPKVLETFALQASEGITINLLAAKGRVRAGLEPAGNAWVQQYRDKRPLALRYANPKLLNDRLIVVDNSIAWDISQSFEDLAARSPATLAKAGADSAAMKIEAYCEIFANSDAII